MHDVLRFWLDRGIDGFRVDVVHASARTRRCPTIRPSWPALPHAALNDHPATHAILRDLRRLVDAYPGDRMLVGEVFLLVQPGRHALLRPRRRAAPRLRPAARAAHAVGRRRVARAHAAPCSATHAAVGAWPTLVLSNHDTPRHRTRFGSEARARAAAVLLLTLPGTPFLYAGEELGPRGRRSCRASARVDPGGRDGCRAPIPWDASPGHGWAGDAVAAVAAGAGARATSTALRDDPSSILHLYRRLLAARRASPALHAGDWTPLRRTRRRAGLRARRRRATGALVLVNFTSAPATRRGGGRVEVASDGTGEGARVRRHPRPRRGGRAGAGMRFRARPAWSTFMRKSRWLRNASK